MARIKTPSARGTARHYEALGRVLDALRNSGCSPQYGQRFDHWTTLEGHIALEWWEGPHPWEVATALVMNAADPEDPALRPGDIHINAEQNRHGAPLTIEVRGLQFQLRGFNTIGMEAVWKNATAELME
ncbi:hypothetical protein [Mycobacteroides saopaulense]|nr:hypothetical protein [Mycobacteroides saopaulense]